ncbi:hypothetical protein SAMN05421507_13434 [Lentzea jiangxiensis]|uniref:Uncharacterized protein n=1 Tax=Lentzea jiangxiensis TaxID=641025 RepID=A0A1H0X4Y7_9PSEU|nr:hypothetical protein SAMN05421507_13434 [Lentzea jiangxiensis]
MPAALAPHLQQEITANQGEDLVALEGNLRATAATLMALTNQAEHEIAVARHQAAAACTGWGLTARLRRRTANAELTRAIQKQSELRDLLDEALTMRNTLREFVIGFDAPAGLLRESADGWQRSPHVPASVIVFGLEDSFVAADSRRLDSGWAGARVAGETYGEQWRRDGDSPDSRPLDRAGPWRVGFSPRTGEVYASRRCGYLSQKVWLLGREFEAEQAHDLLTALMPRMREPTSLILAAGVVHVARSLRPRGPCATLSSFAAPVIASADDDSERTTSR